MPIKTYALNLTDANTEKFKKKLHCACEHYISDSKNLEELNSASCPDPFLFIINYHGSIQVNFSDKTLSIHDRKDRSPGLIEKDMLRFLKSYIIQD